jgi:hypothetical protein
VLALFAGVEVEAAFWTLADGIGEILQQGTAFGTAGDGSRSRHVDGARAESIFSLWTGSRRLLEFFFCATTGILVSALAILAVGQKRLLKNESQTAHCPLLALRAQDLLWSGFRESAW